MGRISRNLGNLEIFPQIQRKISKSRNKFTLHKANPVQNRLHKGQRYVFLHAYEVNSSPLIGTLAPNLGTKIKKRFQEIRKRKSKQGQKNRKRIQEKTAR